MADDETMTETSAPETSTEQAPTVSAPTRPEYLVRSGILLHDGTTYKAGEPFWTDDEATMAQHIRERTVILAVEAQGMEAVGRQLAEKDAQLAQAAKELADLRAQLAVKQSGRNR